MFNPASVSLDTINIDGKPYKVDCLFFGYNPMSMDATLRSYENNKLPVGTVRFIGKIPWAVKSTHFSKSRFLNWLLYNRFEVTYLTIWDQVLDDKIKTRNFLNIVFDKTISSNE